MAYEHTIRSSFEASGVGLHSGAPVKLRVLPAPAGKGIVFRRTDLDGYEVEATGRNVAKVSYATSLMKKGVLISTTEHLLSAFFGIGLDNAIVELDNLELPILDGSARPFVELALRAGLKKQKKKRIYLRALKEVEIRDGDKFIALYPGNGYSVSYAIDFPHPLVGKQRFEVDLMARNSDGESEFAGEFYHRDIAAARTFGFLRDEAALRQMGLIRGASPQNALILDDVGLTNGPLRYADEFVRHKVLDLIGDLALLGHRILGRIVADRAGHAMHTALVSRLLKYHSLCEATTNDGTPDSIPVLAREQSVTV